MTTTEKIAAIEAEMARTQSTSGPLDPRLTFREQSNLKFLATLSDIA